MQSLQCRTSADGCVGWRAWSSRRLRGPSDLLACAKLPLRGPPREWRRTRERAVCACDVSWVRSGSDAHRRRLLSGPRQEAACADRASRRIAYCQLLSRSSRSTNTFVDELSKPVCPAYADSLGVRDTLTGTRAPRKSARARERESARAARG